MTSFFCTDVGQEHREVQALVESNKAGVRPVPGGPGLSSLLYGTLHLNVQIDCTVHPDLKMLKCWGGHTLEVNTLLTCMNRKKKTRCL